MHDTLKAIFVIQRHGDRKKLVCLINSMIEFQSNDSNPLKNTDNDSFVHHL